MQQVIRLEVAGLGLMALDQNRQDLAEELGGLPLALDQSGAFVAATGVSLAEYLDLYRQRGQTLRARRGPIHLEHPTVTVTFTLGRIIS